MTISRELIERQSGVYAARIDVEGEEIIISVCKVIGGLLNTAEATTTAARLRAFNDPKQIVKDTINLLIKSIEKAKSYGQARV